MSTLDNTDHLPSIPPNLKKKERMNEKKRKNERKKEREKKNCF